MSEHLALIVDDEPDICELLEITLGRMNIQTRSANDIATARDILKQQNFDLCLTDMRLPDGDGIDLVRHIQENYSAIPTAVITAHGNMECAIEALKAGAFDFVSKPVDLEVLRNLVTTALKLPGTYPKGLDRRSRHELLGESDEILEVRAKITKLARSQAPVYISGESGTGKELVARLIHEKGPRSDRSFVPVNCGAIPAELMESEFFGHKKGSFTGAVADKMGLFQAAQGGTLFLDEIADLPISMQVKLLRAIQEKSIRPIGAQHEVQIDVRILSATHKDLAAMVEAGDFRQDLFYRINVIELNVPPLRQRLTDIPLLANNIIEKVAASWDIKAPVLTDDALDGLCHYSFPGNVRELENILERAMTLCENDQVTLEDLGLPSVDNVDNPSSSDVPEPGTVKLDDYLTEIEKEAITKALEKAKYNKTKAAELLGMSFRSFRYKLKKLGID